MRKLKWARRALEERDYDEAAFCAGQAVQLYLKAVLYRLTGDKVRGHEIRSLLGLLSTTLANMGFESEALLVREFSSSSRALLAILEEAYGEARYGMRRYTREEAEKAIEVAEKALEVLARVEEAVLGSEGLEDQAST